ncbi:MAG: CcdB family protein [Gammaproteobacteria bacterium]
MVTRARAYEGIVKTPWRTCDTKHPPRCLREGVDYVLVAPQTAGIPRRLPGEPVTHLERRRADILAALDFLLTGF